LAVAGAACSSGTPTPAGAPVLTKVYWSTGGAQLLVWSLEADPALMSPVPPYASEVDFVFDRRLDGTRIEDIVTVNGVTTATPKSPPSVRASWPDMSTVMSDPPFDLVISYNSAPTFGGLSSFVFARPADPGFPADTTVTFELVPTLLTSVSGDPAIVPPSIPVKTQALSVTIAASTAPVEPSYQLPLAFSNRLPDAPPTSPFVHVRVNGGDVPYRLLGDASRSSRWFLEAAECFAGGWPAGATYTVTVDAGFRDAFGDTLASPATASFSTGPGPRPPATATCALPPPQPADGGTDAAAPPDGAPDGGADAPADVASVDASTDAAVDSD
jgi:hypothetical protein